MDIFSTDELRVLLEKPSVGCVCVSMFMPSYRGSSDVQQNPIRLKNLLRVAEERLVTSGLRGPEAVRLLKPVRKLFDNSSFWRHISDGLAIFVSQELFRYYRLPVVFNELLLVSDRFHIKPLLSFLSGDGRFYVLVLSQKQTRLLQCTHYGVKEMSLAIPQSLPEFLKYDELDRQLQFHHHSGIPASGNEPLISHGPGVEEGIKDNLLRYFQQVNKGLHQEILKSENAPLVVAGVEYLHPIYQQSNTYRYLLDTGVFGNPDSLRDEQIRDRAWEVVHSYFEGMRLAVVKRYRETVGTGRTSTDVKSVVREAYYGKVELLFVADGVQRWGIFDPASASVELHQKNEPCDEDLLDFTAAHTLAHRGTVYMMPPGKMPDKALLAAVFRY